MAESLTRVAASDPVVPIEVGVPESVPVVALNAKPGGRPVAENVFVPPPPTTLTVIVEE
jgi:hypothetical protein